VKLAVWLPLRLVKLADEGVNQYPALEGVTV